MLVSLAIKYVVLPAVMFTLLAGLYRLAKGPTVIDRAIAFDLLGIGFIAAAMLLAIVAPDGRTLEVAPVLAALLWLSTAALGRYLEEAP